MKAEAVFEGTQLKVTLTAENDGEKVLLLLADKATPMTNLYGENANPTGIVAMIELDKSKRT